MKLESTLPVEVNIDNDNFMWRTIRHVADNKLHVVGMTEEEANKMRSVLDAAYDRLFGDQPAMCMKCGQECSREDIYWMPTKRINGDNRE